MTPQEVVDEWDGTMQAAGGSRVPWERQRDILVTRVAAFAASEVRRALAAVLTEAADIERSIALDSRHTKQEILGAHMLGSMLRARFRNALLPAHPPEGR